ncbi:ATP-dependent DNA helicase pfh1 [Penicillium subrubescens]|uniref:ATP-dependent DNA helicase n=2 Tax=Penicillium subrubescens TaxID=1316194 RepID=A0A1Q5UIZ7_9EURO|nr:ATP-dependent DNA helicase pfh1 [Penicillium subrubescens]OKP11363.1 ATP-dependent DNA helicase pfh1 [Penicillium subrubescens]OKP12454.1 ATP-dependent DNA helicase pfh1 [Penicillium subrubescens]
MLSSTTQGPFCTGCARPWLSTQFVTCDGCRRKAARWKVKARQRAAAAVEESRLSTMPPSRPLLRRLAPVLQAPLTSRESSDISNAVLQPAPRRLDPSTERSLVSQPPQAAGVKRCIPASLRATIKKQRTLDPRTFQDTLNQALGFLRDEVDARSAASNAFPPEVSSSHVRTSIARYEEEISAAANRDVCCSCGKLVPKSNIYNVHDMDPLLLPLRGALDTCGRHDNTWDLCSSCHASLNRNIIPKFSARNMVNVTMCQNYPPALKDLTLSEEYLIAKCHPLGVVLKLRPGGRSSPVNYHALRGHFIVIPQDPGPLLDILPGPDLTLHSLIKVFWLGARPPVDSDLSPFLAVRKAKVLAALQYLVQHNHLYHNITVNYRMIDDWSDDFIPPELRDNIICLDELDHHEREGYTVSLRQGNYENDLQAAQDSALDSNGGGPHITGSIFTDINGERQDPNVCALDALVSVVTNRPPPSREVMSARESERNTQLLDHRKIPVVSYTIRGEATLMDHWTDPHYFTAAFPTLFPAGIGGHLDERTIPVSLAAFADWALRHHSRRFARHKTFMYLLYDVIQLRKSSMGNGFLVKRQNWQSTMNDIASLTVNQLQDAAKTAAAGQKIEDLIIRRLLRNIETIGMQVPGSFAQKLRMRSEIRGLIARYGMPAFWITINPSDLRNPLVLILAGVEYSGVNLATANAAIREAAATSNPVAVAEFFNHVCKAILDGLFATNTGQTGILGDLSNHFAVVETNGRGMLHLHGLAWARGNLAFTTLRDRLLQDSDFAARMIRYLESIITQGVDESILHDPEVNLPSISPSATDNESDNDFHLRLSIDSNCVARKMQVHSKNHLATCFKYRKTASGKNACRFGMPRDLVPTSYIDKFGLIHLARNHAWINPWNPAIASCVRSNQDISWIPTVSKSLSLIYYITNYATKDDVSPWQIVAKAALLRHSIEKARKADPPTATDLRLREKGMGNFALRCFNTLSHDREISGVQVASVLLQLPTYYTVNYSFTRINLWWLRRYVRAIIRSDNLDRSRSSDSIAEEPCAYETGDTAPVSIFDNYKWRGPHLASLALFEYCMLVKTKNIRDAIADDADFDPSHPRYTTHVQRLARSPSQVATVTFSGQLTEFQAAEDAVLGGHPKTTAIINDMSEILLGLFVPWTHLVNLFRRYATQRDTCIQVWTAVEPTLPFHIRAFARNIELLRKSKEDCQADAKLWKSANGAADSFHHDVDELEPATFGSDSDDAEGSFRLQDETFNAETLIAAYHSITKAWHRESLVAGRRIPPLLRATTPTRNLDLQNLQPLDIPRTLAYETSGLQFVPPSTLQEWESRLKGFANLDREDTTEREVATSSLTLDDFDVQVEDNIFQPALTSFDMFPDIDDHQSRVGENPTGASLTSLVIEVIPLNQKQHLIVESVLSEALTWADHPYDSSQRKQTLLYVGGEGGTGKSQIVKAIEAGMSLVGRKHEVILMAPTGAAADNIGGNTYHTSLGISIDRSRATAMSSRVRRLWSRKTIMFVDEVSMMDLTMIGVIDNHCKIAKSLDRSSTDLFGGLPVVIFIGDFFQFPPVRGPALWKEPRTGAGAEENGRLLWHHFKQVIILDEQMRQSEDAPFRDLLSRARAGTLTEADRAVLNSKTITSLASPQLQDATTIVKLNSLRHQVNRVRIEQFARARCQNVYIFPALHSRTRSTGPINLRLRADDLLQQPDQGTKVPFPGLFLYTPNMPAVILTNICTLLGLVNGAAGTAVGIVVDQTAEFFQIDDLYIMCTKPPACILFKPDRPKPTAFQDLEPSILPVFPLERSITLKGYSVRRKQVPMCPAYCLTDYKVQGSTLVAAILDLKDDPTIRGQDRHRKYCSTYVQLSRLRSSKGLHLLQEVDMEDLRFGPDPRLLTEMQRLQALEKTTIAAWQEALDL